MTFHSKIYFIILLYHSIGCLCFINNFKLIFVILILTFNLNLSSFVLIKFNLIIINFPTLIFLFALLNLLFIYYIHLIDFIIIRLFIDCFQIKILMIKFLYYIQIFILNIYSNFINLYHNFSFSHLIILQFHFSTFLIYYSINQFIIHI